MLLSAQGALPPSEAHADAMKTAVKVVELSPDLAEGRTSLAHVLFHTDDLAGAEREFKRAQQIKPNYALAHHWYGEFLRATNRPDEAFAALQRAKEPICSILQSTRSLVRITMLRGSTSELSINTGRRSKSIRTIFWRTKGSPKCIWRWASTRKLLRNSKRSQSSPKAIAVWRDWAVLTRCQANAKKLLRPWPNCKRG